MNTRRGYTLLETAVVLGISIFALIALVATFLSFNRIYGYEQVYAAVAGSASASMSAFEGAILPADQIMASYATGGTTYTTSTTTLVLELPSIDSSGAIISGAKDYAIFYASSTALYRIMSANAASVRASGTTQLSGTLSSLSLTYDNADPTKAASVTVDIATRSAYKTQTASAELRERLYLRN